MEANLTDISRLVGSEENVNADETGQDWWLIQESILIVLICLLAVVSVVYAVYKVSSL